jgi:hypothetical protein
MPVIQLNNTAEQVKTTLSETYTRLLSNWVGPLTASTSTTSQFIIQNPNKGNGIGVGNSCIAFFNNTLNFEASNTDLCFNISDTRNFIVTGNGAIMQFNGNGTFSVGQSIDLNYKGLQVFNSCPGIVLKDSDAINGFTCNFITFLDSTGRSSFLIKNQYGGGGDIMCGGSITSWNNLDIKYDKTFTFGGEQRIFLAKDNGVSFLAGNYIDPISRFYVGSNMKVVSGFEAGSILTTGFVCSLRIVQSGSGVFGIDSYQSRTGVYQYINFSANAANQPSYVHSSIESRRCSNGGSDFCFYTTAVGDFNSERRSLAMQICSDKKIVMQGDLCAYNSCFTSIVTNNLCNLGGNTYLGANFSSGSHLIQSQATIDVGRSIGSWIYCFGFDLNRCVCDHVWFYKGGDSNINAPSCMILNSGGFSVPSTIYSRTGIINSGFFCSSGSVNASLRHNNITLIGTSTSQSAINISGNICTSGILSTNSLVCATNFCSTGLTDANCFRTIRGTDICISNFCVSSSIACIGQQFCANGICSTSSSICGSNFCQTLNSVTSNCFYGNLNVGATCNRSVNSINSSKAWGSICMRNGWVVNNNEVGCFHNISLIGYAQNGNYGIVLSQSVKAPFSVLFSTRSLAPFPWTSGSGEYNAFDGFSNNGISPISAHLLTCAYNSITNTLELVRNNNYYCVVYFSLMDNNIYQTNWNAFVANSATVPDLINFTSNVQLVACSPVNRINYLKGVVDFSVFGT